MYQELFFNFNFVLESSLGEFFSNESHDFGSFGSGALPPDDEAGSGPTPIPLTSDLSFVDLQDIIAILNPMHK
jgi:hypothetical protein